MTQGRETRAAMLRVAPGFFWDGHPCCSAAGRNRRALEAFARSFISGTKRISHLRLVIFS